MEVVGGIIAFLIVKIKVIIQKNIDRTLTNGGGIGDQVNFLVGQQSRHNIELARRLIQHGAIIYLDAIYLKSGRYARENMRLEKTVKQSGNLIDDRRYKTNGI